MLCMAPMTLCRPHVALWASIALFLPLLEGCEPWEDGPPPATAAANVNASPAAPTDPGAPATEAPPAQPPVQAQADAADDSARYASGEYAIGADTDAYDDNDPSALNDFRGTLESHGTWVDDPTYGTVWQPAPAEVGADFRPYVTAGHWAYDDDYVWVSEYSWGWAPFHYGRWIFIEGRGWAWIPGREYRGAWVSWSVDDGYGYLGWAPLGPTFLWFGGVPVGWHGYWGPRWSYVPRGDVFAPRVGARVIVGPSAVVVASRMRPYAVESARVSVGPPPSRFGYAPAQIPRVSGAAAAGVMHAQQFARPSTGRAIGASPPTRFEARPVVSVPQTREPLVGGARPQSFERTPAASPRMSVSTPGPTTNFSRAPVTTNSSRVPARPAATPQGHFGGGGSVHVGGGGHHR
jgi:hypothetical protein